MDVTLSAKFQSEPKRNKLKPLKLNQMFSIRTLAIIMAHSREDF